MVFYPDRGNLVDITFNQLLIVEQLIIRDIRFDDFVKKLGFREGPTHFKGVLP